MCFEIHNPASPETLTSDCSGVNGRRTALRGRQLPPPGIGGRSIFAYVLELFLVSPFRALCLLTSSELQTDDWTDSDDGDGDGDDTDAGAGAGAGAEHSAPRGAKSTANFDLSHAQREIRLLRERLSYAQNELRDYQTLVRTRLEVSTLDALKDDAPLDPPPKRDDDTHYFESYGGSGASHRVTSQPIMDPLLTPVPPPIFVSFKMSTGPCLTTMCGR